MKKSLLVIIGATGDLAIKKIFPILKNIDNLNVATYSRKKPDTPHHSIIGELDNLTPVDKYLKEFNFDSVYFYVALPPSLYFNFIKNVYRDLATKNIRIALEKPFGSSYSEAKKIAKIIKKYGEQNFYLVDHYAAKESILKFVDRRSDIVNKKIQSVEISISETERLEKRGAFFDQVGIIKDTVQNHMLLLAQKVLDKEINIHNFTVKPETIILGQFEGYKNIEGVHPESNTHTYFKATFLHEDMEFKLFSAKAQDKNEKHVKITFTDKTQHIIYIDEMSEFGKTPHEQIIKDFVSDSKKLSINIDDALNQWGIVEQLQI